MCRIYVLITKQPIDNRIQQNFSFWEDTAGTHQYEGVGIRNQMEPRTGSRKFCWKDKRRDASTLHMIFESDGSIAWHKWDWKLRTTEKIVLITAASTWKLQDFSYEFTFLRSPTHVHVKPRGRIEVFVWTGWSLSFVVVDASCREEKCGRELFSYETSPRYACQIIVTSSIWTGICHQSFWQATQSVQYTTRIKWWKKLSL